MTDAPADNVLPFDASRSRRAGSDRARAAHEVVELIREQRERELAARLDWMRRHAGALGLTVPEGHVPTRETEREWMLQAGPALRNEGGGPPSAALALARAELRELEVREREGFHALMAAKAAILGLEPPPAPEPGQEAYFSRMSGADDDSLAP